MIKFLISAVIVAVGLGKALYDFNSNPVINYTGMIVIIAGVLIWLAGRFSLGKFFILNLGMLDSHKLVKKGIYKHIRHPIYLGMFLIFIGIITMLSGILTGAVMAVITLPTMIHDIVTEERFLSKELKDYKDYCKQTKRIIPFLW